MNRMTPLLILVLLALLLFSACEKRTVLNQEKPTIVTTLYPYELIVKQLVDTLFTVQTLLPPNASPHTWSPSPQDIILLGKADLVVANGLDLESNLNKTLARIGSKLITASDFIDKTQLISHGEEHTDAKIDKNNEKHDGYNPHIWTSPDLLIPIVIGISSELGKRYPFNKDDFESRARLIIMELNQVDGKIKTQMQNYDKPAVITLHNAFVYFFRYFKIDYVGSVQPSAGKDPTPKLLKELADTIKSRNIKAIFIEPQMNPKPVEVLAKELNLRILKYDDLGTTTGAKTISEYLWWNWNAVQAGF